MSTNSPRRGGMAIACAAIVVGIAIGAGAMLWLREARPASSSVAAVAAPPPQTGPCNGKPPL